MKDLTKYRTVIFDCDGVVLDSNRIKTDAFAKVLKAYDHDLVEKFLHYHKTHGGVSRFIKFDYFFKEFLRYTDYSNLTKTAVDNYSEIVKEALKNCSYIPGILPLLKEVNYLKLNCYLVSGGAENELCEVFKYRNIERFFKGIYGSPTSKSDIVDGLKRVEKSFDPVIYFGDARFDMEIAEMYQMDFVFVSGKSEWEEGKFICQERGHTVVPDYNL